MSLYNYGYGDWSLVYFTYWGLNKMGDIVQMTSKMHYRQVSNKRRTFVGN